MTQTTDSVEKRMQDAAEQRLQEVDQAFFCLEDDPDNVAAQEAVGLWCGGCDTCTVREVLQASIPILLQAIRDGELVA